MLDKIISVGFFMGIVFLSIGSMFTHSEYVNNIANGVAIPIFVLGILDFITRLKNNTSKKIEEKKNIAKIELKWLTPYCDLVEKNPDLEDKSCLFDRKYLNENIEIFENAIIKIEKIFLWCVPIYAVIMCATFLLAVLANHELVKGVTLYINSTALTLWTLSIFLFDAVLSEYLSKKLIIKVERDVRENIKKINP